MIHFTTIKVSLAKAAIARVAPASLRVVSNGVMPLQVCAEALVILGCDVGASVGIAPIVAPAARIGRAPRHAGKVGVRQRRVDDRARVAEI